MSVTNGQVAPTVGTLYNHFKDREALLGGCCRSSAGPPGAHRRELRTSRKATFRDWLGTLLTIMLSHAEGQQQFLSILMQGEIGRYQQTFPSACHLPTETMKEVFGRVARHTFLRGVSA